MDKEAAIQKLRKIPVRQADIDAGIVSKPTFSMNFYLASIQPKNKSLIRVFNSPKRRKK